jgi:hypothetical protein
MDQKFRGQIPGTPYLSPWRGTFGTATLAIRLMTGILPVAPPVLRDKYGVPGITDLIFKKPQVYIFKIGSNIRFC